MNHRSDAAKRLKEIEESPAMEEAMRLIHTSPAFTAEEMYHAFSNIEGLDGCPSGVEMRD